ncbi:hypothetical protein BV898_14762 [Hypsibius exemplaris]|uniref:G-protein coupled receptors family 1 profile domain-containing protein n=1 Tax=Hypsibius exemplaris TaxID=2072580 RepID=A0A9X6RJT3_HYPEX|nr:hypothetical protein BV898_14762 [Hypsibius exemplaris]
MAEIPKAQNLTVPPGNNDSDSLSCHWPQEDEPFPTNSQHFPLLWIYIIGRPILISLGTIGGLLIFLVQIREKKKATTNVYLMVMSLSSICLIQKELPPALETWNATMTKVDVISCVCIWLTLLVTNILLTKAMAKHERARQAMVSESQHDSAKRRSNSKSRTSSILLLCSAVIYSVTQFPFLVYNLLTMAEEPPHCWINIPAKTVAFALVFGGNLSILGYAIDFFVFYLSSRGFRRQVRSLFAPSHGTTGRSSTFSTSDGNSCKRPLQPRVVSRKLP